MKPAKCQSEKPILRESRLGLLSDSTQDHLAACDSCSTALRVDRLLQSDASQTPALEQLPDPTIVWWRSQQQARLLQTERATLPIRLAERLALVLGALGLVIGLTLTWPMLQATLNQWVGGWVRGFSQTLPLQGSSWILALSCSLFVLVGFGLYTQAADQ